MYSMYISFVKKLSLSFLLIFALLSTSHAFRDFKLDKQATNQAPWKVGEEVARVENAPSCQQNLKKVPGCGYYRKFLGVSQDGYYAVQDFYDLKKTNIPYAQTKQTSRISTELMYSSPYLVMSQEDVTDTYIWTEPLDPQNVNGLLTLWHIDGSKFAEFLYPKGAFLKRANVWNEKGVQIMEVIYGDDKIHGIIKIWRDDGSLEAEGGMKGSASARVKHGPSRIWYKNGQKRVEGSYHDGARVGIWRTWDEQGKLVKEETLGAN